MAWTIHRTVNDGDPAGWLNCQEGQTWEPLPERATQFETEELAQQLADDWSDYYAMKGYRYRAAVTELVVKHGVMK